jgi:hypothetical protein
LKINNLILIRFLIFSSIRSKLAKQIWKNQRRDKIMNEKASLGKIQLQNLEKGRNNDLDLFCNVN